MVRILGVDPGSRVTGYAVVCAEGEPVPRLSYLECGVLKVKADAPVEQRLAEIAQGLNEVIGEFRPDVVAVEDAFHAINARSAIALGQARGAILAVAGMAGLPVHTYSPAVVKQAVTGRGRATKLQVSQMVTILMGLRRLPQADAADALAVAITHANSARMLPTTGRTRSKRRRRRA
ncbi:MAG: crossover junction endodeoxyribonuclease RuvC [Pseudomonadota bacterium]